MKTINDIRRAGVAAIILPWLLPSSVHADFNVTDWSLGSSAYDYSIFQGNQTFNGTPQPNFSQSLNASYANSLAQVAYAYNYSLASGQFNTNVHLEGQGGSHFRSTTDNLVRFTPSTDVLLTVNAQWQFQIAAGDRITDFFITAGIWGGGNSLMEHMLTSSTVFGGPHTGTWTIQDSVLVPAGQEYFFRSEFSHISFSGSPTALSIGTGFANFSLTTVPQPAALGPFALALLLIRKRRTRWHS